MDKVPRQDRDARVIIQAQSLGGPTTLASSRLEIPR